MNISTAASYWKDYGSSSSSKDIRVRPNTSTLVVQLENGDWYLVSSLCTRNDTQIIRICTTTGALQFVGLRGVDVFDTESEAVASLVAIARIKSTQSVRALLGWLPLADVGLLLVATRVRLSYVLPTGDEVFTVAETQWFRLPLLDPTTTLTKAETRNITALVEYPVEGVHFYCETADVSRPFPSKYPVDQPSKDFVMNDWLSAAFRSVGLVRHCVVLVQGVAESRNLLDANGRKWVVALVSRRCRIHPGTRYLARGMNAAGSPGNEVECEQMVWSFSAAAARQGQSAAAGDRKVQWSSYTWRRGTVPIWWGAEIKNTVGEAEIYICDNPYFNTVPYYTALRDRYLDPEAQAAERAAAAERGEPEPARARPHDDDDDDDDAVEPQARLPPGVKPYPVTCINLLRCAPGKPETLLSEHFQESLRLVRRAQPSLDVCMLNFDWHANVKSLGEEKAVEGLWAKMQPSLIQSGLNVGEVRAPGGEGELTVEMSEAVRGTERWQRGMLRYNCADSLDRTNLASYFGAVQLLVEQCRLTGISIYCGRAAAPKAPQRKSTNGGLPPGWESRLDSVTGHAFYIDHNTRTTTWVKPEVKPEADDTAEKGVDPLQAQAYGAFSLTVEECKGSIMAPVLTALVDLFLLQGDMHAAVYTGSKAMHTHMMHLLDVSRKKSNTGVASNLSLSLQRRYINMVSDGARQHQIEMFLAMNLSKDFPSIPADLRYKVVSRWPAVLLKPVPAMWPSLMPASWLLGVGAAAGPGLSTWVCLRSETQAEVLVYLNQPCRVRHVVLTIQHGVTDTASPLSFDVKVGRTMDTLRTAARRVGIPRCASGTRLVYPLPDCAARPGAGASSLDEETTGSTGECVGTDVAVQGGARIGDGLGMYNFMGAEGEVDYLSRVVLITFHAAPFSVCPLMLGPIQVLGDCLLGGMWHKAPSYTPGVQPPNPDQANGSGEVGRSENGAGEGKAEGREERTQSQIAAALAGGLAGAMHQVAVLMGGEDTSAESRAEADPPLDPLTQGLMERQECSVESAPLGAGSSHEEEAQIGGGARGVHGEAAAAAAAGAGRARTLSSSSNGYSAVRKALAHFPGHVQEYLEHVEATPLTFRAMLELELQRLHLGLSLQDRSEALKAAGLCSSLYNPLSYVEAWKLEQTQKLAALSTPDKVDGSRLAAEKVTHVSVVGTGEGAVVERIAALQHLRKEQRAAEAAAAALQALQAFCPAPPLQDTFLWEAPAAGQPPPVVCMWTRDAASTADSAAPEQVLDEDHVSPAAADPARDAASAAGPGPPEGEQAAHPLMGKGSENGEAQPNPADPSPSAEPPRSHASAADPAADSAATSPSAPSMYPSPPLDTPPSRTGQTVPSTSLAIAPYAGFLNSVPTDPSSAPPEMLLSALPANATGCWRAPPGVQTVELTIVLPAVSLVSQIVLQVGSSGYSPVDAPVVEVATSMDATPESLTSQGFFHVRPTAASPAAACPPASTSECSSKEAGNGAQGGAPTAAAEALSSGWDDGDEDLLVAPRGCMVCALPAPARALLLAVRLALPEVPRELLGRGVRILRVREEDDDSEGWVSIPPAPARPPSTSVSIFPDNFDSDSETPDDAEGDANGSDAEAGAAGEARQGGDAGPAEKEEEAEGVRIEKEEAETTGETEMEAEGSVEVQSAAASSGQAGREVPRCIHLARLRVVGSVTRGGEESVSEKAVSEDRAAQARALEDPHYGQAVPTLRTRIAPLWEEVRGDGRMLFLALPLSARWISGFRIAAPPAPCPMHHDPPALVLRIGVHTEAKRTEGDLPEDLWGPVKPVGEYAIPLAKEGTLLHFDFVNGVAGNIFVFELAGHVSSAARTTGDGGSDSDNILQSLAGRIKVFQYSVAMK